MARQYLISCITRTDRINHDRRIAGIGGVNRDGTHWRLSHADAIAAIEAARWSFYLRSEGRDLPVVVAFSRYGSKYLKSSADTLHPETLLALPDCR